MDVVCDDDEQAKRRAEQLVDGHAVELWQEARKIAEFRPLSSKADPLVFCLYLLTPVGRLNRPGFAGGHLV